MRRILIKEMTVITTASKSLSGYCVPDIQSMKLIIGED